jgi:RHH-type transcriptional regulator, proline utilization regulon repressor / proline dehydrogenase / delta 1-pyrroline-5-carboxylate dehydrogenase
VSLVGIPKVVGHVLKNDWQVFFYEEFEAQILPGGLLSKEIQDILDFSIDKRKQRPFRKEAVIDLFPFLCGVRPEERSIFIGNRRLSRELALLKAFEGITFKDRLPQLEKDLFNLKTHVEKISTISSATFPSEIEWVSYQEELPEFWNEEEWEDVNKAADILLKELVSKVSEYRPSLFERVSDYGLTLTAKFDLIRVHLLKFLALLPSLDHDRSGKEVKRNLLESLRRLGEDSDALKDQRKRGSRPLPFHLSFIFGAILQIAAILPAQFLATFVRHLVRKMAKRFIAGESISTSHKTIKDLRADNRQCTLDQLGELVVSSKEADEYFEKVIQLIQGLRSHIPKGEKNSAGILNAHVSIKVSALCHEFKPHAFEATFAIVAPRLRRILQEAKREEVFINVDAEHYHYRDLVLEIFAKVLLETPDLSDYSQTGIVVQAYLRDGAQHLKDVISIAQKRKIRMPIRLVKGAYWDAETIEGEAHQFVPPQFLNKEESDLHFRQLAHMALENYEFIHLAIGSHNLQDHAFVESVRALRFPEAPVIEHQCLHMTYEALSHGLAKMGWPTRNYMPIGNLLVGMAYLVRRIMENSSQVGVLSIMRSHQKASGLQSPVIAHRQNKQSGRLSFDSVLTTLQSDFSPARPLRLHLKKELRSLREAMKKFHNNLLEKQSDFLASADEKVVCSSNPALIVGTYKKSSESHAQIEIDRLLAGLESTGWGKKENTLARVASMLHLADRMLLKRNELSALIIYEAGKTMTEALGDVDEAIDFINFYTRQEIKIQIQSERVTNRGVFSVIAPWNFPLAIPCGMAVAPLVAGNAVILKPAEQTPLIGQKLYEMLLESGIPSEVLGLVQGDGAEVGAPLVKDPRSAGVVFTGSKAVGQWIYQNAGTEIAEHYHDQFPIQKKIITEMGGKNAVIVTNNCELDETISGILYGAFGHAGQKCSAASRLIVHREVKDALVTRLIQAMKDLKVGESFDPSTSINPLISEADQKRVRKSVEEAKDEAIRVGGKIHIDRSFEKLPGFCVGPVLFELPKGQSTKKDSWAQREIFGPVIHLVEYDSLIEAIELFNGTEYALTGGIFSQSQDDIDFLLKFLRAGNIYVNRPNTGARVAIEPFGGFKLSGTGPKAGGNEYLWQFHFTQNPNLYQDPKVELASDSGYELLIPRPSLISIQGRISRFEAFSKELMEKFELILGSVSEKDKAQLMSFSQWILSNLESYLNGRHANYFIPGQLSYNDKSLIKDSGLFVAVSGKPNLKSLHYFMAALALGSGVAVACVSESAYSSWKGLLEIAWKSGFSKVNLDISLVSPEKLKMILREPKYSYVYAGQFSTYRMELYKDLLPTEALSESMRSILSEIDGVGFTEPSLILDQFVWTRSFAINTMRHGAPLELS